jgi:Taurine catabolism dioxygenase TauD, TfdA family
MSLDDSARVPYESSSVWRSGDLTPIDWSIDLSDEQRDVITASARTAIRSGLRPDGLTADLFPLHEMEDAIAGWSRMLSDGRGFVLLRRFPIDVLTDEEVKLAYVGLGVHLGEPVSQNAAGEVLTHIRDDRLPESGPEVRLYRTRKRQDFHTDGADIIGLLCLHRAKSGGASLIASSGAVYNEMLRRRPDLLEVLYQPMCWDRQGGDDAVGQRWFELAPITDLDGVPRIFYIGWYIRDAQRHADVHRLTREQLEAMELLESIANDPTVHVEMDFEPGDVQLLNNGRILHARDAYEDADDPAERRHLLRLWLAAHRFTSLEQQLREGISTRR